MSLLSSYPSFRQQAIKDRFIKHADVVDLLHRLPAEFTIARLGKSVHERSINLVTWGNGPIKIFAWSQMHGDEPTGTAALFDLFNFLTEKSYASIANVIRSACTLYMIPMVNPDGAEVFTRRNAQQIDINRDFLAGNTPEGRLLKATHNSIDPDFGFNLHDQVSLWSVKGTNKPASLSYLAPAIDTACSTDTTRERAKLVIAEMYKQVHPLLPGQIGLFDETFEPRAFGDNFQKAGTSTILIEGGGFPGDPERQEVRKYFFLSLLAGFRSIASNTFIQQQLTDYHGIPANAKTLYHLIIHNVHVNNALCSISLNYEEKPDGSGRVKEKVWVLHDAGDVSGMEAYNTLSGNYIIDTSVIIDDRANFDLMEDGILILSFKNGILVHSAFNLN